MDHGPQNSTGNPAAAAPPRADPVVFVNSDESVETAKRGRKDNDTRKVNKKKRALPQEAKESKRMKDVKQELGSTGEELKQFNAALSNIQSEIMEMRMGCRLVLQKLARQGELMVDTLDAIEEDDFVKVYDLLQILFST